MGEPMTLIFNLLLPPATLTPPSYFTKVVYIKAPSTSSPRFKKVRHPPKASIKALLAEISPSSALLSASLRPEIPPPSVSFSVTDLFFVADICKGSTARLEWNPSPEPFTFGSFGLMDLRSRVQKTSSNNHILCSNAKIVPYVSSDETALLRENSRKFNLDLGRPNELFSLVKTIDLLLKPGVAQYFRSKGIDTSFMYEESGYLANVLDSHSVIFRDKKLNFAEVKEPIDEVLQTR